MKHLEAVAAEACAHDLPHSELTLSRASLLDVHFQQRGGIAAARLNTAMRSFAAMTRLLMPEVAIDNFVEERLKTESFPNLFEDGVMVKLVPGWAGNNPINVWKPDGTMNRKASIEKFTHAEVLRCAELAATCPDLPLSLIHAQYLIEQYLASLRREIAKKDQEKAVSLAAFQNHWGDAANFNRVFMMGLSLALDEHNDTAIERVDQELVNRMFALLEEIDAFNFHMPEFSHLGLSATTFSCPAHPFLKQFMTGGTFMRVVNKYRALAAGHYDVPFEQCLYEANKKVARLTGKLTRDVAATGDKEAFRIFQELGKKQ